MRIKQLKQGDWFRAPYGVHEFMYLGSQGKDAIVGTSKKAKGVLHWTLHVCSADMHVERTGSTVDA